MPGLEHTMISIRSLLLGGLGVLLAGAALAKEVVIDVRTEQEYQAGHVEGALLIPHEQIAQKIGSAQVNKDDHVILYCRSGRRSGIALDTLKGMGFSHAENYGSLEQARKRLQKP
jgi:phage shock protein E